MNAFCLKTTFTSKTTEMRKLLAGISIIAILSCANQNPKNTISNGVNSVHEKKERNQLDTLIFGKRLVIKDTTQYSASFVNDLKQSKGYETLKVIDDSLFYTYRPNTKPETLVTDKYAIPTNLEQNKEAVFLTKLRGNTFTLILKRTNYTNIKYQLKQDEKTIKSGVAMLQDSFYFGAENTIDEKGERIFLNQYIDKKGSETYIKIEIEHAERASVAYCVDEKTQKYETLPIFIKE